MKKVCNMTSDQEEKLKKSVIIGWVGDREWQIDEKCEEFMQILPKDMRL